MGYEVKIYFGNLSQIGDEVPVLREIANIDLANPGYDSQICRLALLKDKAELGAVPCRLYGHQCGHCGEAGYVVEDSCGADLMAIPIGRVVAAIERDDLDALREEGRPYLRFRWARDLARSLSKHDGVGFHTCTHAILFGH